ASCFTHLPISVHSAFEVFNGLAIEENRSGMVFIGFPVKPLHEVPERARLSAIQRLLIVELLPVPGLVVGGALGHQPSDSSEVLVLVWDPLRKKQVESRSEEHTSELQSRENLVCRLLLEKKKKPKRQDRRAHMP